MKVSNKVASAYKEDGITKYLNITFPNLDMQVELEKIYSESQNWSEAVFNKDSIEFVGCISSKYGIKISGLKQDVKGKELIVDMYTEGTEDEPVRLFKGIVDSAVKTSNKQATEIIAYDELYTKGNIDIASWYKAQKFPCTIRELRYSLFAYLGIEQVEIDLPNDDIVINKKYDPNALQALPVIKAFCQINGAFGIMNRYGLFDYRIMNEIYNDNDGAYPGLTCFPGATLFPGVGTLPGLNERLIATTAVLTSGIEDMAFSYYRKVNYEDFSVKPVDKVTIRDSEDDAGVTYGSGTNNYIIQGNMWTYGLSKDVLQTVAQNVYNAVKGFSYYPYEAKNNGLPFVECGFNTVSYMMVDYDATYSEDNTSGNIIYTEKQFPVLSRTMTGIQALQDNYSAKGEEYQEEFVTDLGTEIDLIKKKQKTEKDDLNDNYYNKTEIDQMFESGGGGGYTIESVKTPPAAGNPYTLYCVQGEIVIK